MRRKLRRVMMWLCPWRYDVSRALRSITKNLELFNVAMVDKLTPALLKVVPVLWDLHDELIVPQLIEAEVADGFLAV